VRRSLALAVEIDVLGEAVPVALDAVQRDTKLSRVTGSIGMSGGCGKRSSR